MATPTRLEVVLHSLRSAWAGVGARPMTAADARR
jgi:hypothetical protein